MTVEWIERPEGKYQILYGLGRIQRARLLLYSLLPESIKRAQIMNPDGASEEHIAKATLDERMEYETKILIELSKLVLNAAPDWDKTQMDVTEYVDSYLPEDVGKDIAKRMRDAVAKSVLPSEDKKKS